LVLFAQAINTRFGTIAWPIGTSMPYPAIRAGLMTTHQVGRKIRQDYGDAASSANYAQSLQHMVRRHSRIYLEHVT